jgi:hypothetical protein
MSRLAVRLLPSRCLTERLQHNISRPEAKERKEKNFLFLRTWRALRPFGLAQDMLCASHLFSDSVIHQKFTPARAFKR